MKMKASALIVLFLCLANWAWAQTGSVKGKISDKEGKALPGANVLIKGTQFGTSSKTDGSFEISGLRAGDYRILVSFIGYEGQEQDLSIKAGETSEVSFTLAESAILLGDDIVVSASRRAEKITEAPATISVINSRDIEMAPSFNVGELAAKLQGVEFVRTGVNGVGINIRGFNNAFNAKILALTDGRNSMMAGGSGLPVGIMNTIIKEDVDRVEVVLGPNSALYGPNAHNGVVNTITKDPRKYQGTTVAIGAGNQSVFSGRLRHAHKVNDKFAYKITGEYTSGRDFEFYDSVYVGGAPFYGAATSTPERNPDFNFRHIRGEAHVYYSVNKNSDLILSYGASTNRFLGVNNVGRNQIRDWQFSYLQLRYVSPKLFAQVYNTWTNVGSTFGLTPYTRDFYNRTNSIITDRSNPAFAGVWRLNEQEAEAFARRLGNTFKEQSSRINGEVQYNESVAGFDIVASASYQYDMPNTFGTSLADGDNGGEIRISQIGAALQIERKLVENLKVFGAARLDNHSVFGNLFAPKGGLVYNVPGGSVRATYGRAFAAPIILFQSASIFGIVFGNGNGVSYIPNGQPLSARATTDPLKPEELGTFEMGYKGVIAKKLYVDVNGYYSNTKNFLSPAIAVGGRALSVGDIAIPGNALLLPGAPDAAGNLQGGLFQTYFNYGEVASWGADLGINYFVSNHFNLGIKYSYFNSDITNDNIKNDANRDGFVSAEERSLNAPRNRVVLSAQALNLLKNKMFVNLTVRWVEEYDFYSGNQIGTAAGRGSRGVVFGGTLPNGQPRNYLKNFNHGPLGGFTSVDLSAGYKINDMLNIGAGVSNLFNVEQREFVGSPSIGRLFSVEARIHIPHAK